MESVRYLHAADLHLDATCKGAICQPDENVGKIFAEATFIALDRLVRVAEKEKPDFVVLAGDIYNEEDHSLKAQFALRDACRRLNEYSIPVFIAHGNHDPLSSLHTALEWPDNVTFFGESPQSWPIVKNGQTIAIIQGISHTQTCESRNLAKLFHRDPENGCFQLGVLHCSAGNGCKDRYAPCSLEDLTASGLDAWSLGHAHVRQILAEKPFIAYSGNTQGLHINECGPKGCYLVTAAPEDGSFKCSAKFCQLAPLQWETLEAEISGATTLDDVERLLERELAALCEKLPAECQALVVRIVFTGNTELDSVLRRPETLAALEERFSYLASRIPAVCIRDFAFRTKPPMDMDNFLSQDDLAGEVARIWNKIVSDTEKRNEFAKKTLAPLFDNPQLRGIITMPAGENLTSLFEDARRTGLERLEKS